MENSFGINWYPYLVKEPSDVIEIMNTNITGKMQIKAAIIKIMLKIISVGLLIRFNLELISFSFFMLIPPSFGRNSPPILLI
jgi:hypothetical protein